MCNLSQVATEAQSFRVVNQVLIKSSICLIWWATIAHQIKHMFDLMSNYAHQIEHKIAGCGKTTKFSHFWVFFWQFLPKTFTLYIKNTYFAKKIDSDTISWPEEGLKQFGQSQGGLPPPTQLTNTKIQMSQTSRLSRAINYGRPGWWPSSLLWCSLLSLGLSDLLSWWRLVVEWWNVFWHEDYIVF